MTTDKDKLTRIELMNTYYQEWIWDLLATDGWKNQINDPLLFPGSASDKIIAKFPKVILFESEFDFY